MSQIWNENTCDGGFGPRTFLKRPQHRCFPVKIMKILRTPTLKNICKRLISKWSLISFKKNLCRLSCLWKRIDKCFSKLLKCKRQLKIKHRKWNFVFRKTSWIVRRDRKNLNLKTTYLIIRIIATDLITMTCTSVFFAWWMLYF